VRTGDDNQQASIRGTHVSDEEAEALELIRRGDVHGLATVVALYQDMAVRVAYGITGDRAASEDVVADSFLAAYDSIDRFDTSRQFRPWFLRIVVNRALDQTRRSNRLVSTLPWSKSVADLVDPAPSPEALALSSDDRERVYSEIMALPARQRAVIILRYYADLDERAISVVLGTPLGTVKWRLFAARRRLRRTLAPDAPVNGPAFLNGENT
jgi:RNA polymerase sigma-70 factor, ECF subfamily